jgi:hypothetical protein
MPQVTTLIGLLVLIALCGCEKVGDALAKVDKVEVTEQYCTSRFPSTGSKHKVPNPERPSFCTGPIMWCSYCEYEADGSLITSGSQPCGVCVGAEAP